MYRRLNSKGLVPVPRIPARSLVALFCWVAVAWLGAGSQSVLGAGPGEKVYLEFREQDALYDDPEWQAYVNEIGQRLVAVSPMAGDTFYFYVIDNPAVNAMAFPDGYILVNRGLISYLRSEDELAGVIGHEIGHVVGRHAFRSNSVRRFCWANWISRTAAVA